MGPFDNDYGGLRFQMGTKAEPNGVTGGFRPVGAHSGMKFRWI